MKRKNWVLLILLVLIPVGGVFALAIGYWRWTLPPSYPRPRVVLSKPNARDDFMAAGRMCNAAGGAAVMGPDGKPLQRGGRVVQAYDPGVTRAQLRAVVRRNRQALARMRQGFSKKMGTPPVVSADQQFPELSHYRELARVLVAEGKLAEREGRMRDAVRSYLDCLQLGSMVPHGGPMIHGLVGVAIHSIGLRPLLEVVDRLDGPTAAAAAREMQRLEAMAPSLGETLTWEKHTATSAMVEAFSSPERLRRLAGGDAVPGSSPDSDNLALGLRLFPRKLIIDNLRGYLDKLIVSSRQPYYTQLTPPPMPADPLTPILVPVYVQARTNWVTREARWQITRTRLALRAYTARHGGPPPTLEALVPAYLPSLPQDPFAPGPLLYRCQGTHTLIYSHGPDGDDDGGVKDLGSRVERGADGDVVSMRSAQRR